MADENEGRLTLELLDLNHDRVLGPCGGKDRLDLPDCVFGADDDALVVAGRRLGDVDIGEAVDDRAFQPSLGNDYQIGRGLLDVRGEMVLLFIID